MPNHPSLFYRRFLNNRFAITLFNLLMGLLAIWIFTKIAWVFQPVLNFLQIIAPPFIFAGILFYLLNPVIHWLTKLGMPRLAAILVVFFAAIFLIIIALLKLVPAVQTQVQSLISGWPSFLRDFTAWFTELTDNQTLIAQEDLNRFGTNLLNELSGKQGALFAGTLAQIQNLVGVVGNVVVTISTAPIILFFMLKDGDQFTPKVVALFPTKVRNSIKQMLHEMNEKVGSYVQGQVTVAMVVAIIFMIGYTIIGLRFGLIFGLLAGPLNLIPYFGSALAMVPALIVGAMTSPREFLLVIVVFFIEWLIETQLISPLVMGSKLEMHPITIVVVLLTAGNMFGLAGVILGIPGFAVLKIIVTRLFVWYQQVSGLYEEEVIAPATPEPVTKEEL